MIMTIGISLLTKPYKRMRCFVGEHYRMLYTTNVGGFYVCKRCGEIVDSYYIAPDRRLEP